VDFKVYLSSSTHTPLKKQACLSADVYTSLSDTKALMAANSLIKLNNGALIFAHVVPKNINKFLN
jgi:hypothetical protein